MADAARRKEYHLHVNETQADGCSRENRPVKGVARLRRIDPDLPVAESARGRGPRVARRRRGQPPLGQGLDIAHERAA